MGKVGDLGSAINVEGNVLGPQVHVHNAAVVQALQTGHLMLKVMNHGRTK